MIRLFQVEWLKLKSYKVFWILFAMYFVGLALVCSSGMFLMEYLKSRGADFEGIDPTILPLYDFPDVWQNITYVATFFKLFLAFIVVISVTNEISYRTLRQNVIDGLSKYQFLLSKLMLIGALALAATIFLFLEGLVTGMVYSHVKEARFIFQNLEFLLAYFLEVCTFLSLAFLLSLLIRKSGFVIVLLFMYTLIFEPFIAVNLQFNRHIPDTLDWIVPFLPIKSLNNLIQIPFPKYIFREVQDYVAIADALIVSGWLAVYNLLILWVLRKRDV